MRSGNEIRLRVSHARGWLARDRSASCARRRATLIGAAALAVAAVGVATVVIIQAMRKLPGEAAPAASGPGLRIPRFVKPEEVVERSRFAFHYESPSVLAPFRHEERLDQVVAGAHSAEEMYVRLMHWTRAQFVPGRPDPYPPPDARVILRDIRAGRTGGFCAHYSFVLVQAIQSFGRRARHVSVRDHEVVEAWLEDAGRWTMLDPTHDLQVLDLTGRSLSAIEVSAALAGTERLRCSSTARLTESPAIYFERFRTIAVWLRNDLVSAPLNFDEFQRYRVWYDPTGRTPNLPDGELRTSYAIDLYP